MISINRSIQYGGRFAIRQLSPEDRQRVETFLKRAKALLPTNQCTFKLTNKNKSFDNKYNLRHSQKIDIIRSITVDDFIETKRNEVPGYPDTNLYVFHKAVKLLLYGEEAEVVVYVKEYILDDNNMEMVIVISLHEEGLHDL